MSMYFQRQFGNPAVYFITAPDLKFAEAVFVLPAVRRADVTGGADTLQVYGGIILGRISAPVENAVVQLRPQSRPAVFAQFAALPAQEFTQPGLVFPEPMIVMPEIGRASCRE